jgi:hypothetical protein
MRGHVTECRWDSKDDFTLIIKGQARKNTEKKMREIFNRNNCWCDIK